MSDFLPLLIGLNLLGAQVVFLIIMDENDDKFHKWLSKTWRSKNVWGRFLLTLHVLWMLPVILLDILFLPIAVLVASILAVIILGIWKLWDLGKKGEN